MAIFLRDDGVLSMGNKTPVSILNETLNRKGVTPNYELTYNGAGTLDPIFKYQVSAEGFTAVGEGKTKKEAKHDAAASLLRRMQIINTEVDHVNVKPAQDMTIASPFSGSLKDNFVGMLEGVCVLNKLPLAVYKSICEHGPPHARIFTIECKLSSCTEVAVARTKKQAKHMAAQQMIPRVVDILGNKYITDAERSVDYDNPEEPSHLRDIENGTFCHDISISLADKHNVFTKNKEEFIVPQEFWDLAEAPEEFYDQLENPKEFLDTLVRKLEGICKSTPVPNFFFREGLQTVIDESGMKYEAGKSVYSPEEKSTEIQTGNNFELIIKKIGLKNFFDEDLESNATTLEIGVNDQNIKSEIVPEITPEMKENIAESIPKHVNHYGQKTESNDLQMLTFLTVVCPQGEYVFSGTASNLNLAERRAAVDAIKFLRAMSLRRVPS